VLDLVVLEFSLWFVLLFVLLFAVFELVCDAFVLVYSDPSCRACRSFTVAGTGGVGELVPGKVSEILRESLSVMTH
jgi:hypothetical protein